MLNSTLTKKLLNNLIIFHHYAFPQSTYNKNIMAIIMCESEKMLKERRTPESLQRLETVMFATLVSLSASAQARAGRELPEAPRWIWLLLHNRGSRLRTDAGRNLQGRGISGYRAVTLVLSFWRSLCSQTSLVPDPQCSMFL